MSIRPPVCNRRAWAERLPSVRQVIRRSCTKSWRLPTASAVRIRSRPALAMRVSKGTPHISDDAPPIHEALRAAELDLLGHLIVRADVLDHELLGRDLPP